MKYGADPRLPQSVLSSLGVVLACIKGRQLYCIVLVITQFITIQCITFGVIDSNDQTSKKTIGPFMTKITPYLLKTTFGRNANFLSLKVLRITRFCHIIDENFLFTGGGQQKPLKINLWSMILL